MTKSKGIVVCSERVNNDCIPDRIGTVLYIYFEWPEEEQDE